MSENDEQVLQKAFLLVVVQQATMLLTRPLTIGCMRKLSNATNSIVQQQN